MKNALLLCFFVLAGVVAGGLVADLCQGVPALAWLAYGKSISFAPYLDLSVLRLDLELTMSVNLAQIVTIGLALFFYRRVDL